MQIERARRSLSPLYLPFSEPSCASIRESHEQRIRKTEILQKFPLLFGRITRPTKNEDALADVKSDEALLRVLRVLIGNAHSYEERKWSGSHSLCAQSRPTGGDTFQGLPPSHMAFRFRNRTLQRSHRKKQFYRRTSINSLLRFKVRVMHRWA